MEQRQLFDPAERRQAPLDPVQRPKHYNAHPSGVECIEIAEYLGFNLGNAFKYLWRGGLKATGDPTQDYAKALWYLQRFDQQRGPLPAIPGEAFREIMEPLKQVFNRPSPWCEPIRHALAAICTLAASKLPSERAALSHRAIICTQTAIEDCSCLGRGQEP